MPFRNLLSSVQVFFFLMSVQTEERRQGDHLTIEMHPIAKQSPCSQTRGLLSPHPCVIPSCRWKVHEVCLLALGSVKNIITENVKNGRIQFDMHGFLANVILADLNLAG
jgi:hypothetical protein